MANQGTKGRTGVGGKTPEIFADRNKQRRASYADNPEQSDSQRTSARSRYQQERGATPQRRLANGLLTRGEDREVTCDTLEEPVTRESFTIPQAAEALGRGLATIRRWIEADKIPEPYLRETVRRNLVYTVGELEVIARQIAAHEQDFVYLATSTTPIIEQLHQAVHAYRAEYI